MANRPASHSAVTQAHSHGLIGTFLIKPNHRFFFNYHMQLQKESKEISQVCLTQLPLYQC